MFAYMLATLVVFAFAGTVLMLPAFRSDLADFSDEHSSEGVTPEEAEALVADMSVVIPARNEEETIPTLLESLEAQTVAPREIIVVDDQSEDRTATVAARGSSRVVEAGERPTGWLGKPWALHRGASLARGSYLLFLDADVKLRRTALVALARALLALSRDEQSAVSALSVQPYHRTERPWERLSLLFNILVFIGSARRSRGLRFSMEESCCFGPCILCERSAYDRLGGHGAVSTSVLDDVQLGSEFRETGGRVRSFSGRGIVEFRMYPSGVRALLDGFTKNVLLGARRANIVFRVFAVLWFTGLLAVPPFIGYAAVLGRLPEFVVATVFYTFFVIQIAAAGERLGNFGPLPALFFPIHLSVFLLVLLRAAALAVVGRNVQWKGRRLDPESRT